MQAKGHGYRHHRAAIRHTVPITPVFRTDEWHAFWGQWRAFWVRQHWLAGKVRAGRGFAGGR